MAALLNGTVVTAGAVSTSLNLSGQVNTHTVTARFTEGDGTFTAITVTLQATDRGRDVLDADAQWYDIAAHVFSATEITNLQAMFHINDKSVSRVRAELTTVTGVGTTDTVVVNYSEGE